MKECEWFGAAAFFSINNLLYRRMLSSSSGSSHLEQAQGPKAVIVKSSCYRVEKCHQSRKNRIVVEADEQEILMMSSLYLSHTGEMTEE